MCLITLQQKVKIAEKDIACYKIMENKIGGDNNSFLSLVLEYKYNIGETHTIEKLDVERYNRIDFTSFDEVVETKYRHLVYLSGKMQSKLRAVAEGFHSMTNKKRARAYVEMHRQYLRVGFNFYIVKCIIPMGSEIVRDATGLIVSNQIKIVEVVK